MSKINSENPTPYTVSTETKAKTMSALSDVDLISMVTGNTVEKCRESLANNGTLHELQKKTDMIGPSLELSKRYLFEDIQHGDALCSPQQTKDFLKLQLDNYPHEVFACLFLDNRNRVISFDHLFNGTIDGASVYPREVVRACVKHNAAAVIFTHNHPSGVAEPSNADEQITKRLKEALSLIDVRVLDHMIVGDAVVSFAERGLL